MSSEASRLASYLTARRSQVTPEDVGYPRDPYRRVKGLRREEVADLAGISLEYYIRLEQGRAFQPSEQVLAGLSRALRLDANAAAYLYRLALPTPSITVARQKTPPSNQLVHLIDQWSNLPVYVFDRNQDILITNNLARALFPSLREAGYNNIVAVFSAPTKNRDIERWRSLARGAVAALRFHGDPADPRLQEIVGDLSMRDADFRAMWADHDAQPLSSGTSPVLVTDFGVGDFDWQILNVPDGHFMMVWLAAPGTFAAAAFEFLRHKVQSETMKFIPPVFQPTRRDLSDAAEIDVVQQQYLERAQSDSPPLLGEAS